MGGDGTLQGTVPEQASEVSDFLTAEGDTQPPLVVTHFLHAYIFFLPQKMEE